MPQLNGKPSLANEPRYQPAPLPQSVPRPVARPASIEQQPPSPLAIAHLDAEDTSLLDSKSTQANVSFSFIDTPSPAAAAAPSPKATLILMSLRDELSRRHLELLTPAQNAAPAPEIESDLGLIADATGMIDEALQSTHNLPPQMINDLTQSVQSIVSAAPGGALQSLRQPESLSADVNQMARLLAEQAGQSVPDFNDTLGDAIGSYTQVVNAMDSVLPDLPFPLILPRAIQYNDGNTAFTIPAGTRLKPQGNGGYAITTPGLLVMNNGTEIIGRQISLQLGEDFDGLKLDNLRVNTDDSSTYLEGVEAGINRQDQSAVIAAETVHYDSASGQFRLENARIRQDAQGLDAQFEHLQIDDSSVGQTHLQQRVENETAFLDAHSQDLNYVAGNQSLTAASLSLHLAQGPDGQQLQGSGTQLHFTETNGQGVVRSLQAGSAEVNILNQANGAGLVELSGTDIQYQEGDLSLITEGQSSLSLTRSETGFVEGLSAHSTQLRYQNAGEQLDLQGARADLAFNAEGQVSSLTGALDAGRFQGSFGDVTLAEGALALNYDQGTLASLNGQVAQLQFRDLDNTLDLQGFNLNAQFNPDGSLSQSNLDLALAHINTPDLDAQLAGVNAQTNALNTSLHIDSAQVKDQLESEWNVKVENLDLILNHGETGTQSLDLAVGNTDAVVSGLNAQVRTQNGDQLRVHLGLSEDGSYLQEAFLQIPGGGEVKLQQDDLNVRLGGGDSGQRLSFTQDGQGFYTFTGENLNVDASTRDASVAVRGGSAQVSIDSQRGDLIIEDITGVGIDATVGGQNIQMDIQEMDGFLLKATGISGLAEGAAIHLVPTGHDSTLTAEIRTDYNGIPLRVKLDDVHELTAMASIQTNRAHVYFGDPSGQGQVELSAGPVTMKGSAIEWTAQYHSFSPERMMSSVSRALSSEGYEIVPGVQVELDGVVRLQTPFKNGPHAGLTLLFPRPDVGIDSRHSFDMQHNNFPVNTSSPQDGAMGAIAELGWSHTNRADTSYTTGIHAGLVPGSFLNIQQNQGSTYIGDFKVPTDNISLPTTAIAGVTFRRHDSDEAVASGLGSRTDIMAGAYLNPAGLIDSPYVSEQNAYGVYAGVEHKKNNAFVSFGSTVDLSRDKPNVGAQLRVGWSF